MTVKGATSPRENWVAWTAMTGIRTVITAFAVATAKCLLQFPNTLGTWPTRRTITGEISDLSEGQLRELGISYAVRRERWLDGCETQLPMAFFAYRIHPDTLNEDDL